MSPPRSPGADEREPLSGVLTAKVRADAAARRRAVPAPPPGTAIGYGPGAATDGRVDSARSLIAFGTSVAFGAVAVRPDVIAYDIDRSVDHWWRVAAVAVLVGAVIGVILNRRTPTSGPTGAAAVGLVSAAAWVALFNTGEPRWVEAMLAVALAASVPHLFTIADARRARPDRTGLGAATAIAATAGLGIALGAGVSFVDPDLPWATIAAVGGVLSLVGSVRRLRLPDAIGGPRPTVVASPAPASPNGGAVLLGACLGPMLAAGIHLLPYLAEGWQVGPRYQFLVVASAGVVTAATVIAVYWWHQAERDGDIGTDAALLAVLGGAAMLLVAISQTLPGTVAGAALAVGVAAAALAVCSSSTVTPAFAAVLTGVVCTLAWDDLVDGAGSQRVALALIAAPALVLGAATVLGATPRPAAEPGLTEPGGAPIDLTTPPPFNPGLAPSRTPLLEVRGVEFSYGSVQALFGVDLDVFAGEITAVVGANGAGKTTFLRTIAGLATPSAGSIHLGGRNLAPFSAADRVLLGINQIAAGGAVAEDLSVGDNIAMFGHTLHSRDARAGTQRVLEVFPQFGDRLGQRASSLSGGERQMLALAKALVLRPRLLIIDELSLGLAPIIVSSLVPVIRRLHAEGASVLLVEQSVTVALELADQASCMERGRIVYSSSADALRADPHLLEAAYLEGITAALEHRGLNA